MPFTPSYARRSCSTAASARTPTPSARVTHLHVELAAGERLGADADHIRGLSALADPVAIARSRPERREALFHGASRSSSSGRQDLNLRPPGQRPGSSSSGLHRSIVGASALPAVELLSTDPIAVADGFIMIESEPLYRLQMRRLIGLDA